MHTAVLSGNVHVLRYLLKTAILSWLQNDGTRGLSVDQLKGKQLSLTIRPDPLVVFRAKVLVFRACFLLGWSIEDPLVPSFWSQLRITVLMLIIIIIVMPQPCQTSSLPSGVTTSTMKTHVILLNSPHTLYVHTNVGLHQ